MAWAKSPPSCPHLSCGFGGGVVLLHGRQGCLSVRVGEAGGEVRQPAQHVASQLADVIVGARCWVVQLVIGDGADNPSEVGEHRIQQFSRGVP